MASTMEITVKLKHMQPDKLLKLKVKCRFNKINNYNTKSTNI